MATTVRGTTSDGGGGDPTCGKVDDLDEQVAVDVEAHIAAEARSAPPDRPWVMVNMVASIDGASSGPERRSGSLSGEADRRFFQAFRSVADVILAGAGTVRAENYGAPSSGSRLAVVSGSLALDPASRFFQEPEQPPIVLTTSRALDGGGASSDLAAVADIRAVGGDAVDWPLAVRLLREDYGARVLLVEGGPTVNGQLLAADLVDEFRLTIAPAIAGSESQRIVAHGALHDLLPFRLDGLIESDGFLMLRYLRDRHPEGSATEENAEE